MKYAEHTVVFNCAECRLMGIVTQPERPSATGVLILTGGPQYRAGSHRQFTLLSRSLAEQGIASMRFDYRGMGDSEGDARSFEMLDADIHAATDAFLEHTPGVRHLTLWGLCDAASSALYYAHTDARVNGLILLNPWVHSEAGHARARLKHYYLARLTQASFWKKLFSGNIALRQSVDDLSLSARHAAFTPTPDHATPADPRHGGRGYVDRMLEGLQAFRGPVLVLLSSNDLVAQEFLALSQNNKHWKKTCLSRRISMDIIPQANHTFSSQSWRDQVTSLTLQWLSKPDKIA